MSPAVLWYDLVLRYPLHEMYENSKSVVTENVSFYCNNSK